MVVSRKQFVLNVYSDVLADSSYLIFSTQGNVVLPSFVKDRNFKRLNVKLSNLVAEPYLSVSGLTYCLVSSLPTDSALRDFASVCLSFSRVEVDADVPTSSFFLCNVKVGSSLIDPSLFRSFITCFTRFSGASNSTPSFKANLIAPFFGVGSVGFLFLLLRPVLALFKLLRLS